MRRDTQSGSCMGKTKWPSYTLAQRQAKKMRRRKNLRMTVYRCPFCRSFHVGSNAKWDA